MLPLFFVYLQLKDENMKKKDIQKKYFRFLKENGVYARCMKIHKKGSTRKISDILNRCGPLMWVESSTIFCTWYKTPERDIFWWAISLLWQIECVLNGIIEMRAYDIITKINEYIKYSNMPLGDSIIPRSELDRLKNILINKKSEILNNNLTKD